MYGNANPVEMLVTEIVAVHEIILGIPTSDRKLCLLDTRI